MSNMLVALSSETESNHQRYIVGIVCMAVDYFYTGRPLPITYTPFGETVSSLFIGIVIILIPFYTQTRFLNEKTF